MPRFFDGTATGCIGGTVAGRRNGAPRWRYEAPLDRRVEHAQQRQGRSETVIAFKQILCPVDFSDASARALTYATAFAAWSVEEGRRVIAEMAVNGLVQGERGLEIYVMCEIPSNVTLAKEFAEVFDGF